MAEAYPYEMRDRAEELYVEQGLTYEQAADELGVAVNTLKRWGQEYGWTERKKEYLEAKRTLKENLRILRQNMMSKAAANLDPQDVYAVIRLEKLAYDRVKKEGGDAAPDIDRPKLFLEDLEFVAEVLREVDPEGLKILARNFEEIVQRFKMKHDPAAPKGYAVARSRD